MRDGSTKLILAAAVLVVVWILTYWLWPAGQAPPGITFDVVDTAATTFAATGSDETPPPASTIATPSDAASTAPTHTTPAALATPVDNPIGATLDPAPMPEFSAVTPPQFDEHVVAAGETIWTIAQDRYGDRNLGGVIARANPTIDPKKLRVGTTLLIPKDPTNIQGKPVDSESDKPEAPKVDIVAYIVAPGDTLGGISKQFYGKASLWTRIRDANPGVIGANGDVREGARIVIPPPPEEKDPS